MRIGFILFPDVTQLDFTGPLQLLERMPGPKTMVAAKTNQPPNRDNSHEDE